MPAPSNIDVCNTVRAPYNINQPDEADPPLDHVPSCAKCPDDGQVISGRKPGTHRSDLDEPWCVVRARAGLDDVRLHDLRHSFASRALAPGESLPVIGKLLGHTQVETTTRYAYLARDSVKDSAASIGADILPEVSTAEQN